MNKIANLLMVLLVLPSILGCSNNTDSNEPLNQKNVSQSENSMAQKLDVNDGVDNNSSHYSFDSSMYYAAASHPTIDKTVNKVIWKEGEAAVTAAISKAEGEQASESNTVIRSITVASSNGNHTIELGKKPLGIHSMSLSSNNQLAVHVRDHEGSRLIILNLLSGKQIVLNDIRNKGISSEKIDSYNWSPDGNTIAFGIGDIGSSYIAVYNTKDNRYSELSKNDYRLITSIVWHKDGQGFDFLSMPDDAENPEVLYRYSLKDELIRKVTDNLTETEQASLTKYLPQKIE
ncbi:protein tolB [Shouchella clausii]